MAKRNACGFSKAHKEQLETCRIHIQRSEYTLIGTGYEDGNTEWGLDGSLKRRRNCAIVYTGGSTSKILRACGVERVTSISCLTKLKMFSLYVAE